ncbi:hypothetical protein [Shewanella sp. GutDb-MelDb]|uniref:hypothetical protein n=1 Tax=Shewanella sp. GutDb-MelDb TaxID=2058316 RepID=UPI000C79DC4D|nr:hypothetical protein [Shewanella sp. GutDb-MelDb]PKG58691.1 hypothetical protein CXF82_03225 [Shewanella sp. GutDb-MelDb]
MTLVTTKQTLIERKEYQAFYQDFEGNLSKLTSALKTTKDVQKLATQISEKGFWGTALGSISGRNDKDLAAMIENLGASLEVTQSILTIVLKVQNIKNGFLKEFHQALVEKMTRLKEDDLTLDSNQKDAAIAIVTKIEQQVSYQLAQSEQIENHERKLTQLDDFVEVKEILDSEQSAKIAHLDKTSQKIIRGADNRQQLIVELQQKSVAKQQKDMSQDKVIHHLTAQIQSLQLDKEHMIQTLQSQAQAIEQLKQSSSEMGLSLQSNKEQMTQAFQSQTQAMAQLKLITAEMSQGIQNADAKVTQLTDAITETQNTLYCTEKHRNLLQTKMLQSALPLLALIASGAAIYLSLA